MRRIVFLSSLVLVAEIAIAGDAATNPVVVAPAFVNRLAEEIRTNRLALAAANFRSAAAAAGLAGVRTWEDPMLRLGGMAAEERMRMDNGDILYGAEQKLPLWGKPALARSVARAEVAVMNADADYQFQIGRASCRER